MPRSIRTSAPRICWRQRVIAREPGRALRVYGDIIGMDAGEDSQFAAAERIALLTELGRTGEADAEMTRLGRSHVHPGPAELVAELLEEQGRLGDALTWLNIACRDLTADDDELTEAKLLARPELRGRQRVRRALGLPPDARDLHTAGEQAELFKRRETPSPPNASSFFVRADVERAFAEGLAHGTAPTDPASYFRDVERGWRASSDEIGASELRILPTPVDDLLKYGSAAATLPSAEA